MKKLLTITAISLLLFSCGNKNICNIERAFRQYAVQNFDDPNSIVEILEISPIRTIYVEWFCVEKRWKTHLQLVNQINNNATSISNKIDRRSTPRLVNSLSRSTLVSINRRLDQIEQNLERQRSVLDRASVSRYTIKSLVTDKKNEPPIYIYQIRFRQSVRGELFLRTYYASYTKENGKITIRENNSESIEKYNGSEVYLRLVQNTIEFLYASLAHLRLTKDREQLLTEILEIINRN